MLREGAVQGGASFQPAAFGRLPDEEKCLAGSQAQHARCMRSPLTTLPPQITINNEYSARARGSGFTSKPSRKERKTTANRAIERSRNNRTARLARWF